jgi:anti-sigma regulatory factor (Ser/Thr protein kinase)
MPEIHAHKADDRLTLSSQLGDLKLVWPWVDALAVDHAIPADTRYAIDLCLEEALSNIIRHGYRGEPSHAIAVCFTSSGINGLSFTIDDSAPHFAPREPIELGQTSTSGNEPDPGEFKPGGRGLRLLRRFAGSLAWEQLPDGNRLTISFPFPPSFSGAPPL